MMTKSIIGVVALAILSASSFGGDLKVQSLDLAEIKRVIPPGWVISSVSVVDAPSAWQWRSGSKGLMVSLENPSVTIHDRMVGDYHPVYTFALLPPNWTGTSLTGQEFADGKVRQAEKPSPQQVYPDRYRKSYAKYHYFESYIGHGDWKKPFDDIARYFDKIEESQIIPGLLERLQQIGYGGGSLTVPMSKADLPLLFGALAHSSLEIKKWACLATEKMASKRLFDDDDVKSAIDAMLPLVACGDDKCEEWATRGISAICRYSVPRGLPKNSLAELSESTLKLLEDADGERRRRAANLIADLLPTYNEGQIEKATSALLKAARLPTDEEFLDPNRTAAPSASLRAFNGVVYALSRLGHCKAARPREEVVVLLLQALEDKRMYSDGKRVIIKGLAAFVPRVQGDTRKPLLDAVVASVSDPSLVYSLTSGVPSPPRHAGIESMTCVARYMDREQLEAVEKAISAKDKMPSIYKRMYDEARWVLAKRRKELEQETRSPASNSDSRDAAAPEP